MHSVLQKIFLFLLLLIGHCTNAQVKFSASISPAEIGKDEFAQLKLMVENANEVQQIVPPNLKNFTIVSGPNQESGMTMINGVVKKYIALNFVLKPKAVGVFTIPPAMAKADAGDYTSNPVKLKVTANSSGNNAGTNPFSSPFSGLDPFAEPPPRSAYNDYILRKGENPVDKIKKNMFVKVEVDKKSCYVGEPVVATYKLFTRLKSESNMVKNPSFNGFSVLDLQQPNDMSYHTEKSEGREYNVYSIRKVQLYPLLSGNLDLGIAEIENNVHFVKAEYLDQQPDIFNDIFRDFSNVTIPEAGIENQKVTLQSKPLSILVKPLPEANKPADFKGAVGNFTIDMKVEKNNFSTDDAGRLAIIISGEGNMQLINAPVINWPEGIEGFDSKATDDLYKGTVPVSGRKIFEFPFTVSKPGKYKLPAVTFSFFDIHDSKYKTVSTDPVELTIIKGTGKPKNIIADTEPVQNDNYLTKFFSNRLRVVSLVAVLIIIGLITWLKGDSKKERQLKQEIEEKEAMVVEEEPGEEILLTQDNPLGEAEVYMQLEEGKMFYAQLNHDLKKYLAKKLSIPAEELNRKNIAEHLDTKGVSNETVVQLQQLLADIDWQLYTPSVNNEKMQVLYDQTADMVQLLDTYRT